MLDKRVLALVHNRHTHTTHMTYGMISQLQRLFCLISWYAASFLHACVWVFMSRTFFFNCLMHFARYSNKNCIHYKILARRVTTNTHSR